MIKLQIIGHLGKDCLVKDINGKNVMSFTVAHSEKFKDQLGVLKEKTIWVDCSYWSDRTAIAPYLKKGTQVYAEGFPEVDTYQNKEGQHVAALRMRVMNVQLLGGSGKTDDNPSNGQDGSQAQSSLSNQQVASEVSAVSDDLPF
ncbi:MAG: single-stranded DNA-binding protein [Chitinophagaceae bacterium]